MGLSRALFAGISGLKGQQVKLDIIGNNIANVNTAGFKRSRVTFSDLFSDTVSEGNSPTDRVGGQNPSQIGLGAASPTIELLMTEGPTQASGVATDLSISGEGFFILGDATRESYTRDGNFKLDSTGDLVAGGSNLRVKGWMASRDGSGGFQLDTSKAVQSLNMQTNRKQFAKATDLIDYSSNLDSGSATRDIVQAETFISFKDDSSVDTTKQKPQNLSWNFQKIDANNYQWSSSDSDGNVIATGTMQFNDFGEILDSQVYPGGNTQVNYDSSDTNFPDIFTTSSAGQVDPDNLAINRPDNVADIILDPTSANFLELTPNQRPRAFSFTYDPDGAFIPGSWADPHKVPDLSAGGQNLSTADLDATTGKPANIPADLAGSVFQINNVVINNSLANDKASASLHNYLGLQLPAPPLNTISSSGQISVEVTDDPSAAPLGGAGGSNMSVRIYKNFLGGVDSAGVPAAPVLIGEMHGLSRSEVEHNIAVPGLIQFKLVKTDAQANNWANNPGAFFTFNAGSSGQLNPVDDGRFFTGLPSGFHDGTQGPSKFEVRNIDASQSEYTGDLRVIFNAPTSFQIIDDSNAIVSQGALRDGEADTEVSVLGIKFSFYREGNALTPRDVLDDGFLGTEVRLTSFREAEGKAGPVTVDVPKISQVNEKTGQIFVSEKDINFNVGFASVTPVARKNFVQATANDSLESLNGTLPTGNITIDASRAKNAAVGNYRIEFGVREDYSGNVGYDPYRPHDNPATVDDATAGDGFIPDSLGNQNDNEEDLSNQVLKIFVNGESLPRYIVDLNPADNADGNSAEQVGLDGAPMLSSNFVPPYNFYASMQNFAPPSNDANGLGTNANLVSDTYQHQYQKVNRQINLPNGLVINLSNVDRSLRVGNSAGTAYDQPANFVFGDSFTFDVDEVGVGGIRKIDTYSATFQQGALHSTSIETFDSLGGSHMVTTTFEHTDKNTGAWNYYLTLNQDDPLIQNFLNNPPAGFTVSDPRNPTEEELRKANENVFTSGRQGKLVFLPDGNLDTFNSVIPTAQFKPPDASEVNIKLNMDLITQFEAEFGTAARFRTGNPMGLLEGFSIESDGAVVGSFSNGNKIRIAQLAVATFNNAAGLIKRGNNTWEAGTNSGIARIGLAGTDDRGLINSGVLEGSNVDLTEEFTELIVTQRSFTANGKIITTSDEFLQEILQLKR